ncbi:complement factor H [Esox lucius]|nr:complement factor H [Esox lucius]
MNCLINMQLYLTTLFLVIWVNVAAPAALSGCSGPLPNVPNAEVTDESRKNEYKEGYIIYFSCNFGYITAGRTAYVCEKKKWVSLRKGKCSPKPCELPDEIANGHYTIQDGEDFVFGATIKYTCNDGYQMVSKSDTRTCLLEGWSNHLPVCEVVSCVPETTDERVDVRGIPDDSAPILFGHELSFSCPKPEHQLKGNPQVVCAAGGRWNSRFPTCEDVTCKVGEMHNNLIVKGSPQNNGTMKYGDKLLLECSNPNHILHGESEVVCSTNGHWSHPFPLCSERTDVCGPPPILNNGDTVHRKERYRNGESVEYECQKYYVRSGQSHKTCRNGNWVGQITCLEPCTVNKQLMAERNIVFAFWTEDPNKLYSEHADHITFKCTSNTHPSPDSVGYRQQCLNGFMNLPQCQ